ncbi:uncharacterized protein PAC_04660 [Phialocephala subalpina]|uniref:Alkyl sulfatase C-terminal domain-containing protein n=1 Tax=Phialocephala subalpina TaxID=576137 RepID=A0A1L7WPT8_9HELO|nr:uncharacterized protein PAC_04660 [Phialocephala subalpina]
MVDVATLRDGDDSSWKLGTFMARKKDGNRDIVGGELSTNSGMITVNPNLSMDQWPEGLSVQLDGVRAADERFDIDVLIKDLGRKGRLTLSNGALTYRSMEAEKTFVGKAGLGLGLVLERRELLEILKGNVRMGSRERVCDEWFLRRLLELTSVVEPVVERESYL